jgi:malate dehydrogenase (oxaloacetate-decarboxylating)
MIIESARALADYTEEHYLHEHVVFPPISALRDVSLNVAARVLDAALRDGSSSRKELLNIDLAEYVRDHAWEAKYLPMIPG